MAGPVDLAALGHDEEAVVPVKHLDGLCNHLGERRLRAVGIDGSVKGAVRKHGKHLAVAGLERKKLVLRLDDLVPLGADIIAGIAARLVLLVLQRVLGIYVEPAAGEEVKVGVSKIEGDAVGVAAVFAVGVEAGRCRVSDRDGRQYADLDSRLLGGSCRRDQRLTLGIDAGVVVLCLDAAGHSGRRSSRVRDKRI